MRGRGLFSGVFATAFLSVLASHAAPAAPLDYIFASEQPVLSGGSYLYKYLLDTPAGGSNVTGLTLNLEPGLTLTNFLLPTGWTQAYDAHTGLLTLDGEAGPVPPGGEDIIEYESPTPPGVTNYAIIGDFPPGVFGFAAAPGGRVNRPVSWVAGNPAGWDNGKAPIVGNDQTGWNPATGTGTVISSCVKPGQKDATDAKGDVLRGPTGNPLKVVLGCQFTTVVKPNVNPNLRDYDWTLTNATNLAAGDNGAANAKDPFSVAMHKFISSYQPLQGAIQLKIGAGLAPGAFVGYAENGDGLPQWGWWNVGFDSIASGTDGAPVPEPSAFSLFGIALVGFWSIRRCAKRTHLS